MKSAKKNEKLAAPPAPKGGFRQTDQAQIPEETLTFRERKVLVALRASERPEITVEAPGVEP